MQTFNVFLLVLQPDKRKKEDGGVRGFSYVSTFLVCVCVTSKTKERKKKEVLGGPT